MTADSNELFQEYRRTGRRSLRNRIVEEHMGLAIHIARGFEQRSRRDRDIEQVAMLALVKAVDRFDPGLGVPFTAFAGRTIEGEIKRYFRDSTWAVKVPRGAKELNVAVRRAVDQLSVASGRSPTVDEVAAHLAIDREDVVTGLAADTARTVATIEPSADDDSAGSDRSAATASIDRGFGDIDDQEAVRTLLATLPERERRIIELRFFHDMSQSEIAEQVGLSQMHVSRLLRAALEQLRERASHGHD
jgi:RNA polymerase sigma-B factor